MLILVFFILFALCEPKEVEKWGRFEFETTGPDEQSGGINPFVDVTFGAFFHHETTGQSFNIRGFYDGDGRYLVRFMPNLEGKWTFTTFSNIETMRGLQGEFDVVQPSPDNRGQAKAFGDHSFRWENGEEYFSVGTTCYAWVHQHDPLPANTLETLGKENFNKIRYTVFPKWYAYNHIEPVYYPYEGTPLTNWQFDRFHIPFWQNFEKRIQQIQDLGLITDLILFHPYDKGHWGFDNMGAGNDQLYLRYVVARFASFRSMWWSMANEWDAVNKTMEDWKELFAILEDEDPYQHERSIHNMGKWYDLNSSAITHHSLQICTIGRLNEVKKLFVHKPYVIDECQYEGDIKEGWGQLTSQEMSKRFWLFAVNLGQAGHGETITWEIGHVAVLWWSKGNVLRGQSPPRIGFFGEYFTSTPLSWEEMESVTLGSETYALTNMGVQKSFYLIYWDVITTVSVQLDDVHSEYEVTFIDYYEMTKTLVKSAKSGTFSFTPPSVPYLLDIRGKE